MALTNIEIQTLTLLKSAAAKYAGQDIWDQRRFDLAAKLFVQSYRSDSPTQEFIDKAILNADMFIRQYRDIYDHSKTEG